MRTMDRRYQRIGLNEAAPTRRGGTWGKGKEVSGEAIQIRSPRMGVEVTRGGSYKKLGGNL